MAAAVSTAAASHGVAQGEMKVCCSAASPTRSVGMFQNMTTPEKSSDPCWPSASRYVDNPPLASTSGTPHTSTPSAPAAPADSHRAAEGGLALTSTYPSS